MSRRKIKQRPLTQAETLEQTEIFLNRFCVTKAWEIRSYMELMSREYDKIENADVFRVSEIFNCMEKAACFLEHIAGSSPQTGELPEMELTYGADE